MHRPFGGKRGHPPRSRPPDQNERPPDRMLQTNLKYKQKSEEILFWKYIFDFLTLPSFLSSSSFLSPSFFPSLSLFELHFFLERRKLGVQFGSSGSVKVRPSSQVGNHPLLVMSLIPPPHSFFLSLACSLSLSLPFFLQQTRKKLSRCLGFRHFFLLPFTNYIRQIIVYTWTDTDPTDMTTSCHWVSLWGKRVNESSHWQWRWSDSPSFIHVTQIQFFLSLSIQFTGSNQLSLNSWFSSKSVNIQYLSHPIFGLTWRSRLTFSHLTPSHVPSPLSLFSFSIFLIRKACSFLYVRTIWY